MEEQNLNQQKPLKRTSNKIKDIYDTYVKNDKTKNIPIMDSDDEMTNDNKMDHQPDSGRNQENEEILDDAAFIEMQTRINDLSYSLIEANSKIESLQKDNVELKEMSLRKIAELENFRKRTIKEKTDLIDYANEKLLSNFVEILDDLNSAVSVSSNSDDTGSLKKGLELIYGKAKKMFDDAGVTPMVFNEDTIFDVNFHEALMMMPSEKPEGTVVQVLQNGYMIKDKVLRHAKVITSSGQLNN